MNKPLRTEHLMEKTLRDRKPNGQKTSLTGHLMDRRRNGEKT